VSKPASHVPLTHRPTRVRYGVLAFLCTLSLLLYLDRVCIGQAEKSIREELDLSKSQMSWIFTAFTLAYVLFEVPVGHWGDRHGSRGVIARIVVGWSAFTALTGACRNFASLIIVRFLFGTGEAGAFPNAARVVTRWFPPQDRGKARGAITTASLLGGALAPITAAYLIGLVGWRLTFSIFGSLGIVWAAVFYAWFRDDPAKHPAVNDAERRLIGVAGTTDAAPSQHHRIPWAYVLRSPNVWLMGSIITVGSSLFYMLFYWFPTYLKEGRGLSEAASGWLTSLVMAGGAAGCLSGGYLADWIVRRTGERRWSRRAVGGGSLCLAATCVALIPLCPSATTAALCAAGALGFVQLMIPGWWSVAAEISGPHGAAMFGLMNSLGGVGAMGGPQLAGNVVESLEKTGVPSVCAWIPVFIGAAAVLLAGVVCWLLVDATKSIVGPDPVE
jgi:ACS family glucarate transporter-like MFS transporter